MKHILIAGLLLSLSPSLIAAHNSLTQTEVAAGWELLFDGKSTAGWRTYRAEAASPGWQVIDGELTLAERAGDLITITEYADFEIQLEWQVAAGANSGLFIRAGESTPYIFMTAPEVQILDDAKHPDGRSPLTSAGSNFGLHPVPRGIVKAAGQWNHIRVRVDGNRVTHWLNDIEVVSYELGSAAWQAKVAASKFSAWPAYGTLAQGHIGLQDHGDRVAFRNIKLRVIGHE